MATTILPAISPSVTAATTAATPATSAATKPADNKTLAANFTTFLTLLTTQLRNQNPLDPLDTNQFTQQLVQFAQVEQQLKQNEQLGVMIAMQKSALATTALAFVGAAVTVDGQTAKLSGGKATWSFTVPKPATATINITNSAGQTVHTANFTVNAGQQAFTWDGRDASGTQFPDGNYSLSVVAKDANGQPISIGSEIEGIVDSVDLTKDPPLLSVSGQSFTLDQVKRVVRRTN
jgi:flagellar basal-body rod modification protein FlgD